MTLGRWYEFKRKCKAAFTGSPSVKQRRGKHAALIGASGKSPPRIVTIIQNGILWLDPGFRFNGAMHRQRGPNFFTVTTQ